LKSSKDDAAAINVNVVQMCKNDKSV